MTAWHTSWSMAGKWLIYVPDSEGGEQQLCLPEHMKAEAHLLGAAEELVEALLAVLADCARREAAYGAASVRLSTDARLAAEAALTKAGRTPCSETVG